MTRTELKAFLTDRLHQVETRLIAACQRAGRKRADVTLVAVTKTVSAEVAAVLPELGVLDLGESRPQELWHKAAILPKTVRWHLIGHLQRNKIEDTILLVDLIHAVDSLRLLMALEKEATKRQQILPILLEVNASGEANKQGFDPAEVPGLLAPLLGLHHVQVLGLMTMAAFEEDPQRCRPTFARLRALRDWLYGELPAPHNPIHLSMGMSNDFEVAVEEGATFVRLGSTLFEGLPEGIS